MNMDLSITSVLQTAIVAIVIIVAIMKFDSEPCRVRGPNGFIEMENVR